MEPVSKHLIISGRVQGVGFRYYTYRTAKELNIKGWVKNLQDGTVETVFTGSQENVQQMKERLQEGPSSARVQNIVEVDMTTDVGQFKEFSIHR